MKRVGFWVGLSILVFAVAAAAQTPEKRFVYTSKTDPVEQLTALERQWDAAEVEHQWAFIDGILASDYVATESDGRVWTKAEYLESLKSGESVVTSQASDDIRVRVYGDAAVVTGRTTVTQQYKGKPMSGQYRWTDVWIKDYMGRWKCVSDQSTRLAEK